MPWFSSSVFFSTPASTFCVCSPRSMRITPSTESSFFWKPNSPRRGAFPMVTSPTSRMRTGTPLLLPTTMFPMSSVLVTRPRPRT